MMRRALVILALLAVGAPVFAQDKSDDEAKQQQKHEETRLLKKARRAVEDGDNAQAWQLFFQLEALAKSHENADMELTALEEARAVAPSEKDEARACLMIGHIHMARLEHVASVKAFRHACKLVPDDARAWNSLGYSLHLAGNEEESVGAFEQCIELDKSNKEARYSLGVSARLLGDPAKAKEAHEWLVEHKAELAAPWYFAFESALEKKNAKGIELTSLDSRKAVVELEVALDDAFLDDLEATEKTVARLKQRVPASDLEAALDVAIDETARALELRPGHLQLHYVLGLLWEARGESAKAKAEFDRFAESEKKLRPFAKKARER